MAATRAKAGSARTAPNRRPAVRMATQVSSRSASHVGATRGLFRWGVQPGSERCAHPHYRKLIARGRTRLNGTRSPDGAAGPSPAHARRRGPELLPVETGHAVRADLAAIADVGDRALHLGAVLVRADCLSPSALAADATVAHRDGPSGRPGDMVRVTGVHREPQADALAHWIAAAAQHHPVPRRVIYPSRGSRRLQASARHPAAAPSGPPPPTVHRSPPGARLASGRPDLGVSPELDVAPPDRRRAPLRPVDLGRATLVSDWEPGRSRSAGSFHGEGTGPPPASCGCSSMVEPQPSKLAMRVRFPSPAPRPDRFRRPLGQLSRAVSLLPCLSSADPC